MHTRQKGQTLFIGGYIVWQLILLLTGVVTAAVTTHEPVRNAVHIINPKSPGNVWEYWDAGIYLQIAEHGYTYSGPKVDYGFWPLWPLTIRFVTVVVHQPVFAGIVATQILTLASLYALFRLIRLDASEEIAKRTVLWAMVWPMAFMFTALYSEALFTLLVLLTFYAARRQQWLLAGLAGALLALTRHVGALIIIPLLVEWWARRASTTMRWYRSPAWLWLLPIGTAIFPLVVFMHRETFLAPFNYQRIGLYHALSNPLTEAWRYMIAAGQQPIAAVPAILWLLGAVLVALGIREAYRGRLRPSYAVYAALFFLFPMFSTHNLIGIPRYTIVLFPIYLVLAKLWERRRWRWVVSAGFAAMQVALFALWVLQAKVTL